MSLLSYPKLLQLVQAGCIRNVKEESIQGASIDLHLGPIVLIEQEAFAKQKIVLRKKEKLNTRAWDLNNGPLVLSPGTCVLCSTIEEFHLPDNIAGDYKLNSSMGRIFLEHMKAGWADPTWNSSVLTLELKNCTQHHDIELSLGDRIGQMVFFECDPVPDHKAYKTIGRYNNHKTVSGVVEAPGEVNG